MKRSLRSLVSTLLPFIFKGGPFIFIGGMGLLLFTRPQVFQRVVASVVALGFGVTLIVMVVLGCVALSPRLQQRTGLRVRQGSGTAFVGTQGVGVGLQITGPPQGPMRVEWSRGNYAFIIGLLSVFGPGLIILRLLNPALFNTNGLLLPSVLLWFVELGACALLGRTLYNFATVRHAMLISTDAIVILAGRRVAGRFARDEIVNVTVETVVYAYNDDGSHHTHDNFILVVRFSTGADERFCIADNRSQIDQIAKTIHERLGVPLESSAEGDGRDLPRASSEQRPR